VLLFAAAMVAAVGLVFAGYGVAMVLLCVAAASTRWRGR
jgi:hypothetical protein